MPVSEDIDLGVMTDSEVSGDIDLLSDDDLTMCEEGVNAMLRVWSEQLRHVEKDKGLRRSGG